MNRRQRKEVKARKRERRQQQTTPVYLYPVVGYVDYKASVDDLVAIQHYGNKV